MGKTDVGKLFTADPPAAPERVSGLVGALPPRPKPASVEGVEPDVKGEAATKRRGSARSDPKPVAVAKVRELVVVYVAAADAEWIEAQRRTTGATNAAIILGAIQAAARTYLPGEFQGTGGEGMFAALVQPVAGGRERTVQIGMRILASDRQVLENLVTKVGAPSLSALTRKAWATPRQRPKSRSVRPRTGFAAYGGEGCERTGAGPG